MKWNDKGSSMMGLMVILIIIAVAIIGTIMVVSSMQDYYSPITNGTVDPGGIAESGVMNTTANLTATMMDVGGNAIFWIFFIVFFAVLFGAVYAYTRR